MNSPKEKAIKPWKSDKSSRFVATMIPKLSEVLNNDVYQAFVRYRDTRDVLSLDNLTKVIFQNWFKFASDNLDHYKKYKDMIIWEPFNRPPLNIPLNKFPEQLIDWLIQIFLENIHDDSDFINKLNLLKFMISSDSEKVHDVVVDEILSVDVLSWWELDSDDIDVFFKNKIRYINELKSMLLNLRFHKYIINDLIKIYKWCSEAYDWKLYKDIEESNHYHLYQLFEIRTDIIFYLSHIKNSKDCRNLVKEFFEKEVKYIINWTDTNWVINNEFIHPKIQEAIYTLVLKIIWSDHTYTQFSYKIIDICFPNNSNEKYICEINKALKLYIRKLPIKRRALLEEVIYIIKEKFNLNISL